MSIFNEDDLYKLDGIAENNKPDPLKREKVKEKTSTFSDRFGENWGQGGQRIVDTYSNLYKSYSSNQSIKDKGIRTWNAGASSVMSSLDMIFGSPIYGALGPDGTEDPDAMQNGFLSGMSNAMEFAGNAYTKGIDNVLDEKLTESERGVTQFVGGEGLAEGVGFGVGKIAIGGGGAVGGAVSNIAKSTKKTFGDIKISRQDIEKSIEDFKDDLRNQTQEFQKIETNVRRSTEQLDMLLEKIGNRETNVAEVRQIAKELKIDDKLFVSKLEDVANNNFYKKNAQNKAIFKLSKGLSEKFYKKTKGKLEEFGYNVNLNKADKTQVINAFKEKTNISQSNLDKVLKGIDDEIMSARPDSVSRIEDFLRESKFKADGKANGDYYGYDDAVNERRGELLKYLEDNGMVEKQIVDGPEGKLYSFKYTEKGISEIKNIDYDKFADNYNGSLKLNHIENGLAHYPVDKYSNLSNRVDEGKVLSYAEINDTINELGGDIDLSKINDIEFSRKIGDDYEVKTLAHHLSKINDRYNLKMDDDINKVRMGDEDAIDKLLEQIEELKKNEFITIDRIKNPGQTVNFKSRVGATNRVFESLFGKVNKLAKGDISKKINKLKQELQNARKKIAENSEYDNVTKKAKIENLTKQHKEEILNIKARHEGLMEVKKELKKNIIDIGKNKDFYGDINKVIKKALLPKNWDSITTPNQLKKKINQINKEIELEHARGLSRAIKKELRKVKITKDNKGAKAQSIMIEQALQLEQARDIFSRIKQGDLDVKDLEDLLKEIREINSTGRAKKRLADKKFAESVNDTVKEIEKDINPLAGTKNIENDTFTKKVKGYFSSYDNALLFAPRLIEKIFGSSKQAYDKFIGAVSRAYNQFESFEIKYTDKLARNLGDIFSNNVGDLEEFGQFLYARRRLYDEDGISWIGLDRIMHDKTSAYFKNTDKYLDTPKPEFWKELTNDTWDKIRKTELAGIMLKHNDPKFKQATELWDLYHNLTGKMINKTRVEVDNQFIEADDFYVTFQAKRGPNKEITSELGDTMTQSSYISPSSLKRLTKEIKNKKFVWDYNPITGLYRNGKNARYYAFMQESHKTMMGLFNGKTAKMVELTVDEVNKFSDMPEKYSFMRGTDEIELLESFGDGDAQVKANVKYIDNNGGEIEKIEVVNVDDIKIKSLGTGIRDKLSDEGEYRLRKYIERVGQGGATMQNQSERVLAQMANHFNRLPLMGSASVILKQPLSLLDAQGIIGPRNLMDAQVDLMTSRGVSEALDEIPSIHNRGGGDFLIKELQNYTPGSEWSDKIVKKYNGYVDIAMAPIKYADQWTYKKIWLGAYRDALIQKGMLKNGEQITEELIKKVDEDAMTYADDIANRSASTANPLMMPQVYDRAWSKALFGIFTTQLNRLQIMFKDAPKMYKDGERAKALYLGASLMASNVAEYAVTIAVGKGLYAIGATTWDGYEADWKEFMLSKDLLARITYEQTFIGSKYTGITNPNFGASPIIGGTTKIGKGIQEILESPNFDTLTQLPIDLFGGKIADQVKKIAVNSIGE